MHVRFLPSITELTLKIPVAGGADQAGDDTMYMSYIVAATRPLGPVLLYGTFFLLLSPALKKLAGIE